MNRQPTEFGWWLLKAMADHDPPLNQPELAAQVGVHQSTISRWIYRDIRPKAHELRAAARALGHDPDAVLTLAGYEPEPPPAADDEDHTLIATLRALLDPNSPIPADKRAALETTLAAVISPYEQYLKARSRRGA